MGEVLVRGELVSITLEPHVTMVDVRVRVPGPGAVAAAGVVGVQLPTAACTYATDGETAAIWLGPDEWLITTNAIPGEELESRLRSVIGPSGGAAVDVSGQRTTLRLSGSRARDVLGKGCSLDLHPRAFGADSAAQTMLGLAGVVLLSVDESGADFRILVRTSFVRYLTAWLLDAAAEYVEPFGPQACGE
jgi:sarcosine oxidase subunit gamma